MIKISLFSILLALVAGCGGKNFTVTQVEQYSYIIVKGSPNGEQLFIDDEKVPLILGTDTQTYKLDEGISASKIQIKEGQHKIKILRAGKVVVNRTFFVTSGNTFEVNL